MLRSDRRRLFRLHLGITGRKCRAWNSRYAMQMIPPKTRLSVVAAAAPVTPSPSGKMKSQSNTTLMTAGMTLHHMANLGAPSRRMMKSYMVIHISNRREGMNHSK